MAKENNGTAKNPPAKEKELESLEDEQLEDELETETDEDEDSDEEGDEPTGDEDEDSDEDDASEAGDKGKAKDKTQKRIDQLTAAKKTLEEQLTESKDALDEARERSKFLEDELVKAKQSYGQGVSSIWTKNGKHMYELTNKEFGEVVEQLLAGADASQTDDERKQWMTQLKECNLLRNSGQGIAEQEAQNQQQELELWEAEWGIVSKALLQEAPELKAHAEKLNKLIVPIFLNRKKDNNAKFTYTKLADGGVQAKFKHVLALMKKEGIYDAAEKEAYKNSPNPGKTVGKGASSNTKSTEAKTFTRSQIAKMSVAEFERNEKAIDKALKAGKVLEK